MALWSWMVRAYARAGVSEACLHLQDSYGQNVPYLLWAVWAGARDPASLARATEVTRRWETMAILPLRQVRRDLKPACPPIDDAVREGLREDVKAAELRAERALVETLERLTGEDRDAAGALEALQAASRAWGQPPPRPALAALADALG